MSDTDLSHHYKVLKQFLDISNDSSGRTKSNSSRAARAREKLLKLSSAQFCELSTDVFDELKRRIDESRSEPDFLLPRSTFHPKRNQARQKLSSLPQSRFKDLVSDISYEIERRDMHKPASEKAKSIPTERHSNHVAPTRESTNSSTSQRQSKSQASREESVERSSVASSHKKQPQPEEHHISPLRSQPALDVNVAQSKSLSVDLSIPEKKDVVQKQAIGIQPTTVVPAKANMTWSSDDESDHAAEETTRDVEVPRRMSLSNTLNHSRANSSAVHTEAKDVQSRHNSDDLSKMAALASSLEQIKRDYEEARSAQQSSAADYKSLLEEHKLLSADHAQLQNRFDSIKAENERISSDLTRNSSMKKELDDLKSVNASLRLENQSLKTEKKRHSLESRELSSPPNTEVHAKSTSSMAQDPPLVSTNAEQILPESHELHAELKKLYEKLDQFPVNELSRPQSRKEEQLRNEVSQWQKKYEALKADQISRSNASSSIPKNLKTYSSPNGVIPFKLVARFFSLIETLFLALESINPDPDLLFEKISSIAIAANKISLQGDHNAIGGNRHADTIRDAASHALTATRYYATHSNIMPKIIVERAVAEVSFSVCDTISVFKLLNDIDANGLLPKGRTDEDNDFSSMAKPMRITPRTQQISESTNVDRDIQTPTSTERDINDSNSSLHSQLPSGHSHLKNPITPTHDSTSQENRPVVKFKNFLGKSESEPEPTTSRDDSLTEKDDEGSPATPPRASKLSILDKMKQFERPSVSNQSANKEATSVKKNGPPSVHEPAATPEAGDKTSDKTSDKSSDKSSDKTTKAAKEVIQSAPSRNKSIFQSLRDRFTGDNTSAPAEDVSDSKSINNDSDGPNVKEIKDTSSIKDAVSTTPPVFANAKSISVDSSSEQAEEKSFERIEPDSSDEVSLELAQSSVALREASNHESRGSPGEYSQEAYDSINSQDKMDSSAMFRQDRVREKTNSESRGIAKSDSSEDITFTGTDLDINGPRKGGEETKIKMQPSADKTPIGSRSPINEASGISQGSPFEQQSQTNAQKSVPTPKSLAQTRIESPESISQIPEHTVQTGKQSSLNSFVPSKSSFKVKNVSYQEPPSESGVKNAPETTSVPVSLPASVRAPVQTSTPASASASLPETTPVSTHASAPASVPTSTPASTHASAPASVPTSTPASTHASAPASVPTSTPASTLAPMSVPGSFPASEPASIPAKVNESVPGSFPAPEPALEPARVKAPASVPGSFPASEPALKPALKPAPEPASERASERASEPASESVAKPASKSASVPASVPTIEPASVSSSEPEPEPDVDSEVQEYEEDSYDEEEDEVRQRQDYRKSMAAATFNFDLFDIDDPDNTLTQVLLYLEHQTVQVISTIQDLLSAIKKPDATRGELRDNSGAISEVIRQMTEATNTSMNQTRNYQLKEHGSWVVKSLDDCNHRMYALCRPNSEKDDSEFADRHFKQRLAGISFDIAKCTKELVKTVEEASLKEDIAHLDAKLQQVDDLT